MGRLFLKKAKLIIIAAIVLVVIAFTGYVYYKGGRNKVAEITIKSTAVAIEVQEKKDEIRNNRPSIKRLVTSLYSGKF